MKTILYMILAPFIIAFIIWLGLAIYYFIKIYYDAYRSRKVPK